MRHPSSNEVEKCWRSLQRVPRRAGHWGDNDAHLVAPLKFRRNHCLQHGSLFMVQTSVVVADAGTSRIYVKPIASLRLKKDKMYSLTERFPGGDVIEPEVVSFEQKWVYGLHYGGAGIYFGVIRKGALSHWQVTGIGESHNCWFVLLCLAI